MPFEQGVLVRNGKVIGSGGGGNLVELEYGVSTYAEFLEAYQKHKIVYCKASSSGTNPAYGSKVRKAFMAYVNNDTTPTEVEFQYYRSLTTYSEANQHDEIHIYKLSSRTGWSYTKRVAGQNIEVSNGLSATFSSDKVTLSVDQTMLDGLNVDKFGDFITTSDVTISNVTYHTYWEVAPTASNQVYGVAVHPTNGKLYRIYNNKGAYSAYSYDTNTITGEGIKTKVAKTGTAQSAITDTISASTTLDNAIGTLLNNDATLNADLNSRITTNLTATANVIMIDSPVSVIIMNKIAFVSANINKVSTTDGAALINNMPAPKQKVVVPIVGDNVSGRGYINANDTTLNSYTFGAGWFSFNVCYEVA